MNMMTTVPPSDQAEHDRRARLRPLFAAFERDDMEVAVELLIEQLDALAGDPDLEDSEGLSGILDVDELGHALGDFRSLPTEDDEPGTATEWHTRGRKLYAGGFDWPETALPEILEDVEEDDAAEEDDPAGGELDNGEEDGVDRDGVLIYGIEQRMAVAAVSGGQTLWSEAWA